MISLKAGLPTPGSPFFLGLVFLLLTNASTALAKDPDPPAKSDEACSICATQGWVACARCEEKGTYDILCSNCYGKKKLKCPLCKKAGKVSCIACGGSKKIEWAGGDTDACRFCSTGKVVCPFCDGDKEIPCPDCKKKGKIKKTCNACFGMGGHPCPKCEAPTPCPTCKEKKKMPCTSCLGVGGSPKRREDEGRFGILFCDDCYGGRVKCKNCYGCGRIRLVSVERGTKAGTRKCEDCKGKGWAKCKECKGKGRFFCSPFEGLEKCTDCKGTKIHSPCTVCQKKK